MVIAAVKVKVTVTGDGEQLIVAPWHHMITKREIC